MVADVVRPQAQHGDVTWLKLAALVPELADLERRVQNFVSLSDDGRSEFCANALWYGGQQRRTIKADVCRLVGFVAEDRHIPLIGSPDAYDLVYERLYNLLPDCRHEPGCCWAADDVLYETWLRAANVDAGPRTPRSSLSEMRRQWDQIRPLVAPAVFELAGYRCALCGSSERLTVDHIVPLEQHGTNHIRNLRALCRSCNSRKGVR